MSLTHSASIFILFLASYTSVLAQDWTIINYPRDLNAGIDGQMSVDNEGVWMPLYYHPTDLALSFNGLQWKAFSKPALNMDSVLKVTRDNNGNILLFGDKVARRKAAQWEYFKLRNSFFRGPFRNVNGNIWYADEYDKIKKVVEKPGLPNDTLSYGLPPETSFLADITGNTLSYIFAHDHWRLFVKAPNSNSFSVDTTFSFITTIHADRNDMLWIAAHDSNHENKLYWKEIGPLVFEVDIPFSKNINCITSDSLGRVYFGTDKGIIIKDGNEWSSIDKTSGLADQYIKAIAIDDKLNIWAATPSGLSFIRNSDPTNDPSRVFGKVYHDKNNNGTQDDGEPPISRQMLLLEPSKVYAMTDNKGIFSFRAQNGNNTITWIPNNFWKAGAGPIKHSFVFPLASPTTFNIGVVWDVVHDLSVSVTGTATRPGFDTHYSLACINNGSVNLSVPATLTFTYHPTLTFRSSSLIPISHVGNKLEWQINNLASLERQHINLVFNLPPSTPLGDTLLQVAKIANINNDIHIKNNIDSLHQIVTGSYDPNDKLVDEGVAEDNLILMGTPLTYTVRFQNTGTDTAFHVHVVDQLDPAFNMSTLQVIDQSHPGVLSIDGRTLLFEFADIKLPDSNRN
ncbi:MAG: DUF7619 domain-containing protein, partial [Bacteroidota bacterium]